MQPFLLRLLQANLKFSKAYAKALRNPTVNCAHTKTTEEILAKFA